MEEISQKVNEETEKRANTHLGPNGEEEITEKLQQQLDWYELEDYYTKNSIGTDGKIKHQTSSKHIRLDKLIGETTTSKRISLIGPPHSGKSVLSKKLVQKKIDDEYVTWLLDCEDYREETPLSLEDLLYIYYTRKKKRYISRFISQIKDNQDKCLIVIDGLEKANFKLSKSPNSRRDVDHKTKLHPSDLFALLWSDHFFPGISIVLTSRPHIIAQFPPKYRPNTVLFMNGFEENASNNHPEASQIQQLARYPLFRSNYLEKKDENTNEIKRFQIEFQSFKRKFESSRHYIRRDKSVDEDIGKIVLQKALEGEREIKGDDLRKRDLEADDVQNWLFTSIENDGKQCYQVTDEMLIFHFIHPIVEEYFSMKYMIEDQPLEEFKNVVDEKLFPAISIDADGMVQVEEDKLLNLRRTTCTWISVWEPSDDAKKTYFMEAFARTLQNCFENDTLKVQEHVLKFINDIMAITDDGMTKQLCERMNSLNFRIHMSHDLVENDENDQENFFYFLKKFVKKMKHFTFNCNGLVASDFNELIDHLLSSIKGKIEVVCLENIGKINPEMISNISENLLPNIQKQIELKLKDDRIGFNDLKLAIKKLDSNQLERNLRLEMSCPGCLYKKHFTWQEQIKSTRKRKFEGNPSETHVLIEIPKKIRKKEAITTLKERCCENYKPGSSVVQPKVKYIKDFHSNEIFQDPSYNTNMYDAEPYANVDDIPDVLSEFTRSKEHRILLTGAKGSGKTIIGNRMMLQPIADDQYSTLINLEGLKTDDADKICLKDLLIDNLAAKYGVYNKSRCEKSFQGIIKNPSKCNIILDNYDRASFKLTTSSSPDVNGKMKPGELLGNLFAKRLLPEANILLISRPYAITQLPSDLRPKSLYFVGNLSDEDVNTLFDRFSGKQREEKRNYIDQHFPLAWKLCRNPQMLHILANLEKLDQKRNFFELVDEMCFEFNGDDQKSREDYLVKNSNKLKYLAYRASSDSSITLITDAASKNIQAVQGMMLVKPYENNGQRKKSQIQSHFINPLIQDHYTARYLKEGATEKELKEFVDEKMFPLSAEKDGNCERFRLIRRFCCSNREGRVEINKYFWEKMKETLSKPLDGAEDGNLILDLVETFSENERTKEQNISSYVQNLCEELKRTGLVFHNLIFVDSDQRRAIYKIAKLCPYDVKTVKICGERITSEEFKHICGTMKKEKLKIKKLEVEKIEHFGISTMVAVKNVFPFIQDEVMIDIHDPGISRDLYDELTPYTKPVNKLYKKFKKEQSQGLIIIIKDGAERRYQPLEIKL